MREITDMIDGMQSEILDLRRRQEVLSGLLDAVGAAARRGASCFADRDSEGRLRLTFDLDGGSVEGALAVPVDAPQEVPEAAPALSPNPNGGRRARAPEVREPGGVLIGRLTASERDAIVRMHGEGRLPHEIGAALNRKPQSIGVFLKRSGLVAEVVADEVATVLREMRFRTPALQSTGTYSEREQEVFERLAATGLHSGHIARALHRNPRSVAVKMADWRKARARGVEAACAPAPEAVPEPLPQPLPAPAVAEAVDEVPERTEVRPAPDRAEAVVAAPSPPADHVPVAKVPADWRGAPLWAAGLHGPKLAIALHLAVRCEVPDVAPAEDLALVEGLVAGQGVAGVAERLGWTKDRVIERFKRINTARGDLTHQRLLVEVLRARVAGQVAQAAE